MDKRIRIGTRESQLAVWQAEKVKDLLEAQGVKCKIVFIDSAGDIDLTTPLYKLGVQGIFTKTLDIALLQQNIDIAVHSLKDVPTDMAVGTMQAAVLERAPHFDVLVPGSQGIDLTDTHATLRVATGSIRRSAQWLKRYPNSLMEGLRGNVNTRMQKLKDSNWHGAIFADAGLRRIGLLLEDAITLDWMLPAPAQGAIVVACREGDSDMLDICKALNHRETEICTQAERDFMKGCSGGCSTPISALATITGDTVTLKGSIISTDGKDEVTITRQADIHNSAQLGFDAATELLNSGGSRILAALRNEQL